METIRWKRRHYGCRHNAQMSVYVWRTTKGYVYEVVGKQRSPIMSLKSIRRCLKKHNITIKIT